MEWMIATAFSPTFQVFFFIFCIQYVTSGYVFKELYGLVDCDPYVGMLILQVYNS